MVARPSRAARAARTLVVSIAWGWAGCSSPSAPDAVSSQVAAAAAGRIDAGAARDVIAFNQDAAGNPGRGAICRWQGPVAVWVEAPVSRALVEEALGYWRESIGVAYRFVDAVPDPGLQVRGGLPAGAPGEGLARAVVGSRYPDNRARSAVITFTAGWAACDEATTLAACAGCTEGARRELCVGVFRHELGHVLGFLAHGDAGLMSPDGPFTALSPRDRVMMQTLYVLPFGARVHADGSWSVGGS